MTAENEAPKHAQLREAIGPAMGYLTTVTEIGVLRACIDYRVFDEIPEDGDISLSELAVKTGGKEEMLERLVPYLTAVEILAVSSTGRVAHTDKSRVYRSGELTAGFLVHIFNMLLRPVAQLPTFFGQHGLASPKTADTTPFGLAMGHPDKDVYSILDAEPELSKAFNAFVGRVGKVFPMTGVYDFSWMQEQEGALVRDGPIFVDIGGSNGLAIKDIVGDNKFIPIDRCAVLDLPKSINATEPNLDDSLRGLKLVPGNVFEPLPRAARGSLVYQFRRILNDFADADVIKSWQSVREAAAPDTRVYVVEELLQPVRNAYGVSQDFVLMLVGGKRRNAAMHSVLAETAGFRLNRQFPDRYNDCSVLEFVLQ
ncbi:hypothetical protein NQ176_g1154 [Zarea fungicola]|uniref:Uncharacterized protein n=1 Tax=Zarea fungicola TaxID=93591 RepID=A0ACC1NWJ4_9HYPO|nr:hypothetical protein NQ176_g1154 [Lecanicillium fungicola]